MHIYAGWRSPRGSTEGGLVKGGLAIVIFNNTITNQQSISTDVQLAVNVFPYLLMYNSLAIVIPVSDK